MTHKRRRLPSQSHARSHSHSQPQPPPERQPGRPAVSGVAALAETASSLRSPFPNRFVDPPLPPTLPVVDSSALTASLCFARYIATCTPCVLSPPSPLWPCWRWTNAALCSAAGECAVSAEQRASGASGFGHGSKVRMKFGQFVRRLERGDSSLYITTQYGDDGDDEGEGEDGQLAPCAATLSSLSAPVSSASRDLRYLLAPPLTHLLGDFPLLPPLFASLIPHQYNLWMGHAPRLTSSRLHHDFHCNLYCLLRGVKRITLVSPRYAHRLQLSGRVREVKRNGLVCYAGDGMHEDASTDEERRQERKVQLEERIAALEGELARAEAEAEGSGAASGVRSELQQAEAELDELLDELLVDEGADGGSDEEEAAGRYDSEELAQSDADSADDELRVDAAELAKWKRWSAQSSKRVAVSRRSDARRRAAADEASEAQAGQPPNFSALSAATLPADVPRTVVHLRAPAMLYLPCGWFHEVESESSPAAGGVELGHCALNVWFIPPDTQSEQQPYSQQQLWQERWRRQRQQLEQRQHAQQHARGQQQSQSRAESEQARNSGGVVGRRGWRKNEPTPSACLSG